MSNSARGVVLRGFLVCWAILLIAATTVIAQPQVPARAADAPLVRVDITELSPSVAQPQDTITVKGKVTNTSSEPLYYVQVLLWRNQAPYTDREQLDAVLRSEVDEPFGAAMVNEGNFVDLTRSVASPDLPATLNPGASMSFVVTGTVAQLGIPQFDANYLVGTLVKGQTANTEPAPRTIGRARTFLPIVSEAGASGTGGPGLAQAPVSTIVKLDSTPSQVSATEFVDDHLAQEVAEGGRLEVLLARAERPGVSWAADPELIEALEAMSRGYQVLGTDGPVPGGGAVAANAWLARFDALETERGYQLPYAHLDLAALATAGDTAIVSAARRAAATVTRTASLPVLGLTADGLVDAATLALLHDLAPSAILISQTNTTTARLRTSEAIPVIPITANAFAGGPDPEPTTSLKVRQQMLASGLIAARQQQPIVRIISNEAEARADSAAQAPYFVPKPLHELIRDFGNEADLRLSGSASAANALSAAQVKTVAGLRANYEAYGQLIVNPGDISMEANRTLARAASGSWRGRQNAQNTFLAPVMARIGTVLSGEAVSLGQPVPAILTGRTGSFPLTVTNNLTVPVRVRVNVASTNSSRLRVHSVDEVIIQPGERMQVQIAAEPAANGEVAVDAQLATVTGTPIGPTTTRTVVVTQYGTVGWAIAIGAGIAFFATAFLRIRQVRRERTRHEALEVGPATPSLTSSAPATVISPSTSDPTTAADLETEIVSGDVMSPASPVDQEDAR